MVWRPAPPPRDIDPRIGEYLRRELNNLAEDLNYGGREFVWFIPIVDASQLPAKPQYGQVIFVDATILPGNQEGLHYWDGTEWAKV